MTCPRLFEPVEAAHLETCAECRAAQMSLSPQLDESTLPSLKAAALKALRANPKVRPWWLSALALSLFALIISVSTTFALGLHSSQHRSPELRWFSSFVWLLTMAGGVILALMPRNRRLGSLAVLLPMVGIGLSLAASSGDGREGAYLACARLEFLVALFPFVTSLVLLSGFAFDPFRAFAIGLSTGAVGVLVVHLHCPNGSLDHQLGGHIAPLLLMGAIAVLVRRWMPSRTYAP